MAKLRNSLLTATNTLVSGAGAVNVGEVIAIQKTGTASILFVFDYEKKERNVEWTFVDPATRDAEFALMTVASDLWDVATDGMFVSSSLPTFVNKTGVLAVTDDSINCDKIVRVSKDQNVNFLGTGGKTMYTIVFSVKAVDSIQEVIWSYDDLADRDTVFGEMTIEAADAVYLA